MKIVCELVGLTNKEEGKFYVLANGIRYTCLLENKEAWNELHHYLGHRPLIIEYSGIVGPNNTISVRI